MAVEAGGSTRDDDGAVLAAGVGTVVVGASDDGVATSLCTGAVVVVTGGNGMSASLNTGTRGTASLVLANTLSALDGGFVVLFGATGLDTGCESQQGHGGGGEVHFY